MKNDCTLLATLPTLNRMEQVRKVFESPAVSGVRYNSGVQTPYDPETAVMMLSQMARQYGKTLWVDIKGRQLRVLKWADPLYSCIELNHSISFTPPAHVIFRNGDKVRITHTVDGNCIYVDPLPREALGAGQSVTVLADDLHVSGYLTERDRAHLAACGRYGVKSFMASFVESLQDLDTIRAYVPDADIVSKIESLKGMELVKYSPLTGLMAARDDLYLQCGRNCAMLGHLQAIVNKDPNAICASRIFLSLEKNETPDLADFADLELMYRFGYRSFMLCDNVSNYAFDRAVAAWNDFINA